MVGSMSQPKCVTIERALIAAGALWSFAALMFAIATGYAALRGSMGGLGVALVGWAVLATGAACVASVKYLFEKEFAAALDAVALMHQERDEAWRRAIQRGEITVPRAAPVKRLPPQAEREGVTQSVR